MCLWSEQIGKGEEKAIRQNRPRGKEVKRGKRCGTLVLVGSLLGGEATG